MTQPPLLLLLVGVPPTPSSLRVRVWRRLRSLGAVALKRSAYLLPDTPERYEDFQWLAQEIQREGGEATLIRVQQIENVSPTEVLRLFHEPRDEDYKRLAMRYRKALQGSDRKSAARSARRQEELARLAKDHERLREIDFFDAPGGAEVRRLEEAIAMRSRRPETARREERPTLDLTKLRGRRWVTRPRPHIDRLASAWLIKRFIDPQAEFVFADPPAFPPDAVPFDAPGVELSHQGEDCTFETLMKRARLRDRMSVGVAFCTVATSGLPRRRRVQAFEQGHAVGEHLVVVGRRGEQRSDRHVDAAGFFVRVLAVAKVGLVNDLGEPGEPAIAQARPLDQRLEGAVFALMAQLHAGGVERDGILRKLRRRREDEHRLGIDEALDQPGGGDAIDVWPRASDPLPPAKGRQIEGRPGLGADRFRTSGPHGKGLLETSDLGAAGGGEEVDGTNSSMVLRKAGERVVHPRPRGLRFPVEAVEHLAVAHGELPVIAVAGLVEEARDGGRAHVLDLLDADERRVPPTPLDLLREPLEVLVPLRRVGEQICGTLEGDGAERAESSPHAHAQARRRRRQPDQQEEQVLLAHDH
jgi:hypothetical protein